MRKVDYIVVGLGLAGAAVAMHLLWERKKVLVIDAGEKTSSTRIAAGLFNPVTGKAMSRTWKAELLFPYLFEYYRSVERQTGLSFFYPTPMYRPFRQASEQNDWMSRIGREDFVQEVYCESKFGKWVKDDLGGLLLRNSGYLDTLTYLEGVKRLLGLDYLSENFRFGDFKWTNNVIHYGEIEASHILFCDGCGVADNPFFGWLPIQPLKGEILLIEADLHDKVLFNRGVFIVPGKRGWRVGSTYKKNFDNVDVTLEGKQELEYQLAKLVKVRYEISGQLAGVRPTTPDRRPILGRHPEFGRLLVFNGLGTKGVSLSPYLAKLLTAYVEKGEELMPEVDISRYKSLYWGSHNSYEH